jgi:hypothetical protein
MPGTTAVCGFGFISVRAMSLALPWPDILV